MKQRYNTTVNKTLLQPAITSAPGVTVAHPSANGKGKNAHRQSASDGNSVGKGAPGSCSTGAPIVVQGASRPGCGVGGWVLQDVAVTRP
eukprot:7630190-Pyramimonas_sp.AAC.1